MKEEKKDRTEEKERRTGVKEKKTKEPKKHHRPAADSSSGGGEAQSRPEKTNWKRTFRNNGYMMGFVLRACPGIFAVSLAITVWGAVQSVLMNTYLYKYALGALREGRALPEILLTVGSILGGTVLLSVARQAANCYIEVKTPLVEAYIRDKLQQKAVEVELSCFEDSSFYDSYVKAIGEASDRAFSVMNNLLNVVWDAVNLAAIGAIFITVDPIFLLPAFLPFLVTLLVGKRRNRILYTYDMKKREAARKRDYVKRTFYLRDFSKEMRLTELWRVMFRRMHESIEEMKGIVKTYGYTLMWFRNLFDFLFDVVVYAGTVFYASFRTLVAKTLLLEDCFVVINSVSMLAEDINNVGGTVLKLDENSLYVENLRYFLEYKSKIPEDEGADPAPSPEVLTLRGLGFTYEGKEEPVLTGINLTVRAGERIAVVGENGAGKSTLAKLILRLYDPTEGEILLNGRNIKEYRLSSYRELYGTVFQDYQLFAVSVAENVLLRGDLSEADRAGVTEALEKSGVGGKVAALPHGIDTTVTKEFDSEGAIFSGGEAQKISLARIFAGKHPLVILDEPTSALDPIAEQEMYSRMFEACEGKTVIYISHRLSGAVSADRVYLFEKGRIAEQGSHKELLALGGRYAEMWHKQADAYTGEEGEA